MYEMSETMRALQAGLSLEGITMYLFWISTVSMGAGALFFWLQQSSVPRQYRSAMTVAGIICAVACFHYWRMSGIYIEGLAQLFDAQGNRIAGAEISTFPTAYRYIDWFITVPLLLLEFPLLLALGDKAKGLFRNLVLGSVAMLAFAWIAEESAVGSRAWWTFYLISCAAWGYIVYVLYTQVSRRIAEAPPSIARSASLMRLFILIGWVIYPIGFLMALAGPGGESIREICYNVADVINKVGFGLVCYAGVKALGETESAPALRAAA